MSTVRDIPPVSGSIIWAKQVSLSVCRCGGVTEVRAQAVNVVHVTCHILAVHTSVVMHSVVLCVTPDHLPAQHLPATGGGCAGERMGEPCGGPEA